MFLKFCSGPAPSSADASYKSSGIDFNMPMLKIIMYGKPNQILTINTMALAEIGSENQLGDRPNMASNTILISPKLWLNNPLKIKIEINDGTA